MKSTTPSWRRPPLLWYGSTCAGVEALLSHPAQYDRLRQHVPDRDRIVDEVLRWSSTNAYVQRLALQDVEIRGTRIRAGDSVTLWNVSANRDATQFPNPYASDIDRTPNRHITFGSGIHRCIGAGVGRTELAVLFDARSDLDVPPRLAGPATRLRSNFILGITSLPFAVDS